MSTNGKSRRIQIAELQSLKAVTEPEATRIRGGVWLDPQNTKDPLNYPYPQNLARLFKYGPVFF